MVTRSTKTNRTLASNYQLPIINYQLRSVLRAGIIKKGYTLVELMVVLGIIGLLAILAFQGVSSFRNGEPVTSAQKKFVSDLRLLQNKVNNGADGDLYKEVEVVQNGTSYKLGGADVSLPNGVTINRIYYSPPGGLQTSYPKVIFCFSSPNLLSSYPKGYLDSLPVQSCGSGYSCKVGSPTGEYFACRQSGNPKSIDSGTFQVVFRKGTVDQSVIIEGDKLNINRIYAQ